jgi:hypothetical protein
MSYVGPAAPSNIAITDSSDKEKRKTVCKIIATDLIQDILIRFVVRM